MGRRKWDGKGTTTMYFDHPETGEEIPFEVSFYAWNDPGVHTYRNGDPGYPPDSGIECTDVSPDQPEWLTDKMIQDELDRLDMNDFDDRDY